MPWQRVRIALSLTGLLLAVVAIATQERLVVWAAIGVLIISLGIRLATARRR